MKVDSTRLSIALSISRVATSIHHESCYVKKLNIEVENSITISGFEGLQCHPKQLFVPTLRSGRPIRNRLDAVEQVATNCSCGASALARRTRSCLRSLSRFHTSIFGPKGV